MTADGFAPAGQYSLHNILFPDGSQTLPGQGLVADTGTCKSALRDLALAFPDGRASVADLGCLEGGYAAEFARAGYDVTGVEVRPENYACALGVQAALGLPNLRFIQGDVRDVLPGMQFDAVFCCGLFYHLDRPVAFLNLLGQITRRMLILQTHYSVKDGHQEFTHMAGESCALPVEGPEGRTGHWCREGGSRWASYGNPESFWLCKDDLMLSIQAAGFGDVSERYDWRDSDGDSRPGVPAAKEVPDRAMFVALK